MMRWVLALMVFVSAFAVSAQKNDYVWLSGYDSYTGYYEGFRFGNTLLDFNFSPARISYDSLGMNIDKTNTTFSDSDGKLLFYTNGIYIANSLDEKISNSDSLNAGYVQYVWDPTIQKEGYRNTQGIICIPSINNVNQYYLLHTLIDSFGANDLAYKKVLLTVLDMSANSGHGRVLYKNQSVIDYFIGGELSAIRHGNGRDWWLLVQKRNSHCYYRILINDSGVNVLPMTTCGGIATPSDDIGADCFSPDGTKYVYLSGYGGLNIFNFDRCSGELSDPISLPLPIINQKQWLGLGVAISPNNRFLYVSLTNEVYQFDLNAEDVFASIDTVARYDFVDYLSRFAMAQPGPDGKIYISCGNADTAFHVINTPDLKGDSCGFVQRGAHLPSFCNSVPNFPNYRLGALTGSACDTITDLNEIARAEKERILKVFPNPTSDVITIDYGFTDWNKGEVSLEVSNDVGQIVYTQKLPMYSGFQKLDVSKYATGLYTTYIKRNEQIIAVQKFAKE